MKKVACVVPPFYKLIESKNNRINLGLHYLAEILHLKGHDVTFINGDYGDKEEPYADRISMFHNSWLFSERYVNGHSSFEKTLSILKSFNPEVVILSAGDVLLPTVELGSIQSCIYMARKIKEEMGQEIQCIGYGHLLKYATDSELSFLDSIITGEGEKDILDIVEKNIYGKIAERWIDNLDDLPILTDSYLYHKLEPEDWDYIMARRGCNHKCSFCLQPTMRKTVSLMSPIRLIEEIKYRIENYGLFDFYFCDSIFLSNTSSRSKELLQGLRTLKDSYSRFTWRAEARVEKDITKDFLARMKAAGCRHLKFGVEMLNEKMLKSVNKNIDLTIAERVFKDCQEIGIETTAYVLLGCPGFQDNDYKKMWGDFKRVNASNYVVNITVPYVGTTLFRKIEKDLKRDGLFCRGEPGFFHLAKDMQKYWNISDETLNMYMSLQGKKDDADVRIFRRKIVDKSYYFKNQEVKYISLEEENDGKKGYVIS